MWKVTEDKIDYIIFQSKAKITKNIIRFIWSRDLIKKPLVWYVNAKERLEYDPEEEDFDPDLNDWEIVLKLQSLIAVLNY